MAKDDPDDVQRIRKEIAIDSEKYKWIMERYPDVSLTWFFDQLLTGYMNVNAKSPRDYAEIAARTLGDIAS